MTLALGERMRRLAAWADRFADPGFTFGQWVPATTGDNGVITLGWYDISDVGQRFVSEMYELGWVFDFDWMTWLGTPEGRHLASGPEFIASASADDLARLLTAIIRGERFGDGEIEGAYNSGILPAIARRARELATAD
ncbi:MAG TPA: DUF6508 domain-containing protein [Candidatus Limnocylindrales bacterium]